MRSPLLSKQVRGTIARAQQEASSRGCSRTEEIHLLIVLVSHENEPSSQILRNELGETAFNLMVDRLNELAKGRVRVIKRSSPGPSLVRLVEGAVAEDRIYQVGSIYSEHLFLSYIRGDDFFFLRGYLDFCGGVLLIQRVREQLIESLRKRDSHKRF